MTRAEAIRILDEVIPPPEHHTVDLDHLRIAQAWLCIKEMLTAEPRWIPVSERLPEDVGDGEEYPLVIFCTNKRSYFGFYEYYLGGRWWNYTADEDYVVEGVIAWMPLPEPYKMDGGENA